MEVGRPVRTEADACPRALAWEEALGEGIHRGWAVEVGGGWWVAGGRDICKWGPWDGVVPERGHAVTQLRTQSPGLLGAFREDVGSQHRWFVD